MFKYENFEIERSDEHNVDLHQWREIDEQVGNLKKGEKLTKTGKKIKKRFHLGYYPGFKQAFNGLVNRRCEDAEDMDSLKQILKELKEISFKFEIEGVKDEKNHFKRGL